ncbi:MAG: hypothetical protein AB1497_00475 [Bacillota bacterium]
MKSNSTGKYMVLSAIGLAVLVAGVVLAKSMPDAQGITKTLCYIFIWIGAGILGWNLGTAIQHHLLKKDQETAGRIEIEQKDERNNAINARAKAKAYDLMLMVFGALIFAFGLMKVTVSTVIACAVAYLFVVVSYVYYLIKYQKEM